MVGSTFSGADVNQLRALAGKLEAQAGKLCEIAASSSAAITTAQWTGANIERVRGDWNRSSKPALQGLAQDLSTVAMQLRREAAAQEAASGAAPSVPSFPGGVPTPWILRPGFPPIKFWEQDQGFYLPPGSPWASWPQLSRQPDGRTEIVPFDQFFWEETERILSSKSGANPMPIGDVLGLIPGVGTAFDIIAIGNELRQGNVPAYEIVGIAASTRRTPKQPHPGGAGSTTRRQPGQLGIGRPDTIAAGLARALQRLLGQRDQFVQRLVQRPQHGHADAGTELGALRQAGQRQVLAHVADGIRRLDEGAADIVVADDAELER